MTLILDPSQAPVYNGDILNEVQVRNINIKSEEFTNGSLLLPTKVEFDFTFYGRTLNNNRIYNKTPGQIFHKCLVPNFIEYALQKAGEGNTNAVMALMYFEKTIADIMAQQKPQYNTVTFQES